jgi:hypothetical protein
MRSPKKPLTTWVTHSGVPAIIWNGPAMNSVCRRLRSLSFIPSTWTICLGSKPMRAENGRYFSTMTVGYEVARKN